MNRMKKLLMALVALAALAFGGAQIAGATGGGDGDGETNDGPDQVVTGSAGQSASAAAVKSVGGGTADSVEASDEGGSGAYEVKVTRDGKTHEITLDRSFHVVKSTLDDDQPGESAQGDGDGETNDG